MEQTLEVYEIHKYGDEGFHSEHAQNVTYIGKEGDMYIFEVSVTYEHIDALEDELEALYSTGDIDYYGVC